MNYIPLNPISIKERSSIIFIQRCLIDVIDGAFVLVDKKGIRKQIPIAGLACLMLEPGVRISHAAVNLASTVGTLLVWVGEGGVRVYASGQPGGAKCNKLLYQAKLALDEKLRLKIVRKMFDFRFGEPAPKNKSIEQLRGIEGNRVKAHYKILASQYGVKWHGRKYNIKDWIEGDYANQAISTATSCLYGVTEAAILAAGYAPAIGFLHIGNPLSFVYDIADLFKAEVVLPLAFKIAARKPPKIDRAVRLACRDSFRNNKLLKRIIPTIEEILSAGEIDPEKTLEEIIPIAIATKGGIGNDGYRNK